MNRRSLLLLVASCTALAACDQDAASPTGPVAAAPEAQLSKTAVGGRHGALGTVYVSSQGLWYDTFVSAAELPMHGPFQLLEAGVTEFGPGEPGYLGGRWWIDDNHDGYQNEGDTFLLCPLLGPGRTTP